MNHPSFRELDLVALGEERPGVRQHLATCSTCTAHVETLGRPLVLPVWENGPRRTLWRGWLPTLGGAAAAALAAAVFLPWGGFGGVEGTSRVPRTDRITDVADRMPPRPASVDGTGARPTGHSGPSDLAGTWVAAKGSPSVGIYVKRGNQLRLWDGESPVLPGDRLRIRISPRGYRHVALASRAQNGRLTPLFEGAVGEAEDFLIPGSWEVDDQGGQEELVIGLGNVPVDLETAPWRTELTLPKAAPR